MASTLNLSFTDELRRFIDENSGDSSVYATPSEFVRALLREKKDRMEAARFRQSVLAGYEDMAAGRVVYTYQGNLSALLDEVSAKKEQM